MTWLSFYDHHRQSYGHMPILQDHALAEFMVGDYGEPGERNQGVGKGGEFAIYLYDFRSRSSFGSPRKPLTTQLCVFGDAHGSLREFIACGALEDLECAVIWSADDLTKILLSAGLYDRSEFAVHPGPCSCCHGTGRAQAARLEPRR